MSVLLAYDDAMSEYRFSDAHPMRPERFSLAASLLGSWGMLDTSAAPTGAPIRRQSPRPASVAQLEMAHSAAYVAFVRAASLEPGTTSGHGIGAGDTPAFSGMHEAAALATGGSILAIDSVVNGRCMRAVNLAGGLHHAMRDRASGFCIYDDAVAAITSARHDNPDVRIAYVDIDAHHGDGVEKAFEGEPDVLTISVHESGKYLFPGTGDASDIGTGAGMGSVLNIPLPPFSGPECYRLVWAAAVRPALEAFGPDLIVLQAGADSHANDPLTHLRQTTRGFIDLVERAVQAADDLCAGRMVMLGGGGYLPFDEVPRMWAAAVATLAGVPVPECLPAEWLDLARSAASRAATAGPRTAETLGDSIQEADDRTALVLEATRRVIERAIAASPLLSGESAVRPVADLQKHLADLVDGEIEACT